MVSQELINCLKALGVNALEAEVYCVLLKHNGITAYRLAQLANKATANVYRSVKMLASLGGIIIERSDKVLCYAVSHEIFLSSLKESFLGKLESANNLLSKENFEISQEGIFHLDSAELAIIHATDAIKNANSSIVIDAFPNILRLLKPYLIEAVKRGVNVHLQHYKDETLEGAKLIETHHSKKILSFWNTEQLNLVVDGRECLICLFKKDLTGVIQALWSRDLYLSCVFSVGLSREHFFHELKLLSEKIPFPVEIKDILDKQSGFIRNATLGRNELKALLSGTTEGIKISRS